MERYREHEREQKTRTYSKKNLENPSSSAFNADNSDEDEDYSSFLHEENKYGSDYDSSDNTDSWFKEMIGTDILQLIQKFEVELENFKSKGKAGNRQSKKAKQTMGIVNFKLT